jgi:hypothetical protein
LGPGLVFHPVSWLWPQAVNDREVNLLNSHEARVGTLVRVLDGAKRTGKGRIGIIERTYGHPDYLAMDVRFEDGSVELYWYYELRRTEGSLQEAKVLASLRSS